MASNSSWSGIFPFSIKTTSPPRLRADPRSSGIRSRWRLNDPKAKTTLHLKLKKTPALYFFILAVNFHPHLTPRIQSTPPQEYPHPLIFCIHKPFWEQSPQKLQHSVAVVFFDHHLAPLVDAIRTHFRNDVMNSSRFCHRLCLHAKRAKCRG